MSFIFMASEFHLTWKHILLLDEKLVDLFLLISFGYSLQKKEKDRLHVFLGICVKYLTCHYRKLRFSTFEWYNLQLQAFSIYAVNVGSEKSHIKLNVYLFLIPSILIRLVWVQSPLIISHQLKGMIKLSNLDG